jgi:putative redox protein
LLQTGVKVIDEFGGMMSERVIVRMNNRFETGFWSSNLNQPESEDFQPVQGLHELTPYGMLLASVASCTAQVVLTYAQHHDIPLKEVELHQAYQRNYQEDCDNCEDIDRYDERIQEQIAFVGDLDAGQRESSSRLLTNAPLPKCSKRASPSRWNSWSTQGHSRRNEERSRRYLVL